MNGLSISPFSVLQDLQRDMGRLRATDYRGADATWAPAVDISEDDHSYFIAVDLPGVNSRDVEVTAHNGVLTISGSRDWEGGDRRELSTERWRGEFVRRFSLPEYADVDRIEAKYDNGVLALHLPKVKSAEPRKIEIQ